MQGYDLVSRIGGGQNSEVFKMRRRSDERVVVCKKIPYGQLDAKEKHQLVEEVNILRELKSSHIVKYYEHVLDKNAMSINLVMEHCEGGDLDSFLRSVLRERRLLPEESIWKIFMQVLLAVYEIHRRKEGTILHRDIKPANIFLDSAQNVKLGDFGLARRLSNEENFAKTKLDQTFYVSPEQLKDGVFTDKTDIWACGCLLYQMAALKTPYSGDNQLQVAMNIKNGGYEPIPGHYSKELSRVIRWCLSKSPADRPNIEDLTNIPEVARRLRQKRLADNNSILKKREQEIIRKDKELREQEDRLNDRLKYFQRQSVNMDNHSHLNFKSLECKRAY